MNMTPQGEAKHTEHGNTRLFKIKQETRRDVDTIHEFDNVDTTQNETKTRINLS